VRVVQRGIPRREVIEFYAGYDRGKKGGQVLPDFDRWPWDDPDGLDRLLRDNGLKDGVTRLSDVVLRGDRGDGPCRDRPPSQAAAL
jgi:hypothetical protein